jgi:hypothetical protein
VNQHGLKPKFGGEAVALALARCVQGPQRAEEIITVQRERSPNQVLHEIKEFVMRCIG